MSEAPPLVLVEWEDATTLDPHPWVDNEAVTYRPLVFRQVGFMLAQTPEGVVLTQAWHPDKVAARDQIPRGMIRSITPLSPAPVRRRGKP